MPCSERVFVILPTRLEAFDEQGIPYTAHGGTLFLDEPLHQQFVLGLRALADPTDGVAWAALLRPPFFAIDLVDLAHEKAVGSTPCDDPGVGRVREARTLLGELRAALRERPAGATARDLLERTAFGRTVALLPNGAERLANLRELGLLANRMALAEHLDFEAVTARMRAAAEGTGLARDLATAAGDVERAVAALRREGLVGPADCHWALEYPVAGDPGDGRLLTGFVDFVCVSAQGMSVVDLKTDPPPAREADSSLRAYAKQVRLYGRLLEAAGLCAGAPVRCGLLFTADGSLRWL